MPLTPYSFRLFYLILAWISFHLMVVYYRNGARHHLYIVNAYVEPVASLDLHIVVIADAIGALFELARNKFKIEEFPHSINLQSKDSDIRIQIQTDERYRDFINRTSIKEIMGYKMNVASLEDVLTGKVWAYSDTQRRGSKRQKDLADIMRIIELFPELKANLPESVIDAINKNA